MLILRGLIKMRVYGLRYKIYDAYGGSFKYATNPKYEIVTRYFDKFERDLFIKEYLRLSSTDSELYISNLECFYGELRKINDMDAVINAI
jgi:hypothetical protein